MAQDTDANENRDEPQESPAANCTHDETSPNYDEAEYSISRVVVPCDCLVCGQESVTERVYSSVGEHPI